MTDTQKRPEPKILNPLYAGETPEMLARALLRRDDDRGSRATEFEPRSGDA